MLGLMSSGHPTYLVWQAAELVKMARSSSFRSSMDVEPLNEAPMALLQRGPSWAFPFKLQAPMRL